MTLLKKIEWLLRIAVACIFVGHGAFAIQVQPQWIQYLTTLGFSATFAKELMPIIGYLDVMVGISTLIYPNRVVLIWATFWAFSTALIRPLSGETLWSFVERGGNWIAPLCLLLIILSKKSART